MAKVSFQFSDKGSPIRLTFYYGTKKRLRISTGLQSPTDISNINKDYTSKKNATDYCRNTLTRLRGLRDVILDEYSNVNLKKEDITSLWLQAILDKYFKREVKEEFDKNIIVNYLSIYISDLERHDIVGKEILSDQKYLKKTLGQYQAKKKVTLTFSNINNKAVNSFTDWIKERDGIMTSTRNRIRKNLKSCISYCDKEEDSIIVPQAARNIKMEVVPKSEKSDIIYLNFKELEKIKKANIIGDELILARNWLIIGCFTGQRVSDLMRMKKEMIKLNYDDNGNPFYAIEILQQKTERSEPREISIPLHHEVEAVLEANNGEFPPLFSDSISSNETLFNRHIKKVAEIAGVHEIVKAKVYNESKKCNEIKEIEKCYVLSSHCCRRSFASNFYGNKRITTPQLMAITGHSTEQMLLNYINKRSQDHAKETAKVFAEIKREANK